jgi:eukaryotic-like serine/threonine-protein kinase
MQVAAAFQPPPTRADYYDYQQGTQRMGPQTMMGAGVAPTTVSQYPQGGYPSGYQQGYNDGNGYDTGDTEQGGGGRRWLPWAIGGVVLVAAIIAAVLLLHGGGGSAFVPTGLVGDSQATAVSQIQKAGLVANVHKQTDAKVASGQVISTNPSGGSSIAKGGTVNVSVSLGAGTLLLPNVQYEQSSAAQAQLRGLGFINIIPLSDEQSSLPSGEVAKMTPAPNAKYAPDQAITLYVSGGGVTVPNVSSGAETYVEAEQILQGDGFNVKAYPDPPPAGETVAPGVVYQQNPPANSIEPKGSTIQIFYQVLNATPTATPTPSTSVTPTTPPTTPPATPTPTGSASTTPTSTDTATPPGP